MASNSTITALLGAEQTVEITLDKSFADLRFVGRPGITKSRPDLRNKLDRATPE